MSQKLVTFSGGGWNSLSALYGMTAGALDALEQRGETRDLSNLFANTDAIAGNSGGTWALTTLASSNAINTALQSQSGTDAITSSGFLGQVREAFERLPQFGRSNSVEPFMLSLLSDRNGLDFNWEKLVQNLVYAPAKDVPDGQFTPGSLTSWAQNKHLIFAAGLGAIKARNVFDRALPPQPMIVARSRNLSPINNNIESAARANNIPNEAQVIPLSIELNNNAESNSLFRVTGAGSNDARIDFNSTLFFRSSSTPIPSKGDASQLPLTSPSVYSSAALAAFSNALTTRNADKLAPMVSLTQQGLKNYPQTPLTRREKDAHIAATKLGLARTMDGFYIDNSAIAFGLSALQSDTGLDDNFQISAFINTSNQQSDWVNIDLDNGETLKLPYSITMLFGVDQDGTPLPESDGYPIPSLPFTFTQPNAVVFNRDSLTGIPADPNWSYESSDSDWRLEQRTINVTTQENETFNISDDKNGILNLFIYSNPSSETIAFNNNILDQYDENFNGYREALNSPTGEALIANAFAFNY